MKNAYFILKAIFVLEIHVFFFFKKHKFKKHEAENAEILRNI